MFKEVRTKEKITERKERKEREEKKGFLEIKPESDITHEEAVRFLIEMFGG